MKSFWKRFPLFLVLIYCALSAKQPETSLAAPGLLVEDWPQWRGPNRDGISQESGLVRRWGESGPEILWRAPLGDGYSGITVVQDHLYTMHSPAGSNEELVVCLDARSGKEKWRYRVDTKFTNQFGDGPRATPTVDGKLIFALSAKGVLVALRREDGTKEWSHDLQREFGARVPTWGISTSPLVLRDRVLVDVGGTNGHGFVAFAKSDGRVIWKTDTGVPGYSAPVVMSVNGMEQVLSFAGNKLVSVNPQNGNLLWQFPWQTSYDVNAATPVLIAPDKIFISSGYGVGGAVLQVKTAEGTSSVEQVWRSKVMRNHFSSSVLFEGHLYGFDEATLKCVDVATQETRWATRGLGKGSLLYADGQLIVLSEKGELLLVAATPAEYSERARAQVLRGRCWTMPTLANGVLYLRNQKEVVALNFHRAAN